MTSSQIDPMEFARLIVSARDSTIENFDLYQSGKAKSKYGKFVHQLFLNLEGDPKEHVKNLIPVIVDETISIVLQCIDEKYGEIDIRIVKDGVEASVYDSFERLEPEYAPSDGWVHSFSKERIVDVP